jgi:hypothetical protein
MDNNIGTAVEEELTIGCGRKMCSDYHVKIKANMRKAVSLQKVTDDLYTHDILEYKLSEIFMVSKNRISILTI